MHVQTDMVIQKVYVRGYKIKKSQIKIKEISLADDIQAVHLRFVLLPF